MTTPEQSTFWRFRFDREADLALANAALLAEAHTAKNGEVKERYSGAFNMFCASHVVTKKVLDGMLLPKLRTIQDHVRKLLKNRQVSNKSNDAASGFAEEYCELEKVLDTIIDEVDAKKNEEKSKKDAENKRQNELKQAAESITEMATKRANGVLDDSETEIKPKKKLRKISGIEVVGGMDDEINGLIEQDKMRHDNEAKRLQLEERRLALQEKQFERNAEERRATTDLLKVLVESLKK